MIRTGLVRMITAAALAVPVATIGGVLAGGEAQAATVHPQITDPSGDAIAEADILSVDYHSNSSNLLVTFAVRSTTNPFGNPTARYHLSFNSGTHAYFADGNTGASNAGSIALFQDTDGGPDGAPFVGGTLTRNPSANTVTAAFPLANTQAQFGLGTGAVVNTLAARITAAGVLSTSTDNAAAPSATTYMIGQ